jgi:hypothetical protein
MTIVRASPTTHTEDISGVIQQHVPDAELLSNVGAELSFRLPFSASSQFVDMFRQLGTPRDLFLTYLLSVHTDENKVKLGVNEYGIR